MAFTIMPLAPEPLSGFIKAVGSAPTQSVAAPRLFTTHVRPPINQSMAPEALNTPMPTSMATKKGMMRTAVLKPSLAPSIKAS